MDALTRRQRMQGYEVLWLPGMDHAGIATQNVVERQLAGRRQDQARLRPGGVRRQGLGLEGTSTAARSSARCGGSATASTGPASGSPWTTGLSRAVQTIFKRLYDDGLIYRAERIINWCPRCRTALSDIEVEHHDDDGELVSIRYGDGDATAIVVATTRVETMLGDTAVAVHPDDERYRHLVGTRGELPLTGRRIPVVADDARRPGVRHRRGQGDPGARPERLRDRPAARPARCRPSWTSAAVITGTGTVRRAWTGSRRGRRSSRRCASRAGSSPRSGRTCTRVGHCSRCDDRDRAAAVAAVVRQGRAAGEGRRRRGARRPGRRSTRRAGPRGTSTGSTTCTTGASPGSCGGATGSRSGTARTARSSASARTSEPPPARAGRRTRTCSTPGSPRRCGRSPRWAGRSRPPDAGAVLPDHRAGHRLRHPLLLGRPDDDVRPVRDGRRAARRSTRSPCTAWSATSTARRCRKSRGNVVDPLEWMDALRRRRAAVHPGPRRQPGHRRADRRGVGRRASRNFCTKLWNATRFALINGATVAGAAAGRRRAQPIADRWILSRLAEVTRARSTPATRTTSSPRPCEALYHFAWDEVCDWYLELAKVQLRDEGIGRRSPARARRTCWTRCCGCCTRSSRSSPRRCGRR